MTNYKIGCDANKRFSQFAVRDANGRLCLQRRIEHEPGAIREFLSQYPAGTPVALESVGNWYWIVDEIEAAGCVPHMAHAAKAKVMMGNIHKTDKLDAAGLAMLEHLGSLPKVWIPCGEQRDRRELPRTRMALKKHVVSLKNRIHATLAKYAIRIEAEDIFAGQGRRALEGALSSLPAETSYCTRQELTILDAVEAQIRSLEKRIKQQNARTPSSQLLKTLPGFGDILAIVVDCEVGSISRFDFCDHLASYAGVVPKEQSSGGKIRYGHMLAESNHYLKWAFIEAGNVISSHRNAPSWRNKHVVRLYERISAKKGHTKAIGAVARHLAEAAFWVLKKGEPYREPTPHLPKQA
jgi:transposase